MQETSTDLFGDVTVSPGFFGSKTPTSITYVVGIALFFLPFIEIKCNDVTLYQMSGFELATGTAKAQTNNSFFGNSDPEKSNILQKEKSGFNAYALFALIFGGVGFVVSLMHFKGSSRVATIAGVISVFSLIRLIFNIKKNLRNTLQDKTDPDMLNLNDSMKISVDFTPWFYITIIAFLTAAFLSWQQSKANSGKIILKI